MTDQPTTQERCGIAFAVQGAPTVECTKPKGHAGAHMKMHVSWTNDTWHGSQDVEGGPVADKSETGRALSDETNQGAVKPPSTTQEAEKACDYLFNGLSYPGDPVVLDVVAHCRLPLDHDGPHFAGAAPDGTWLV